MALTSEYLMCLSSGLGCTVMPSAPNLSQSTAAFSTSGIFPPRALRIVAILLMFTLSLVRFSSLRLSSRRYNNTKIMNYVQFYAVLYYF